MNSSHVTRLGAATAFFLALLAPAQAVGLAGMNSILSFLAADTFYYLSVAERSTFPRFTFDGVRTTNGFHPLWQMLLQAVVPHLPARSGNLPIEFVFALSCLGMATGMAFLGAAVARMTGKVLAVALLFPGAYYFVSSQLVPNYGSVWSFANGMESCLSILFFGMFFFFLTTRLKALRPGNVVVLSLLSAGILFSRLDDVFLPFACTALIYLESNAEGGRQKALRNVAIYALPIAVLLGVYLAFNLITVGVAMPVSGMTKAKGLAVFKNISWLLIDLFPIGIAALHRLRELHVELTGQSVFWRITQIFVPALVASGFMLRPRALRGAAGEYSNVFRMLFVYVLLKSAYNFLFVPLFFQGHWYFPLTILIANMALAVGLVRWLEGQPSITARGWRVLTGSALAFSVVAASMDAWAVSIERSGHAEHEFLERAPSLDAELVRRYGNYSMIEFDDGLLNFAMQRPTMSGLGLTGDVKGVKALRDGHFLDYASSLHYTLLGSRAYPLGIPLAGATSAQIRAGLRDWAFLRNEKDLDDFDYSVAYLDAETPAYFIQFLARNNVAAAGQQTRP